MSSFSIESAAKCLGKLLVQEVKYLADVRDKVKALHSELEWMQCFLLDADGKKNNNALIRKWVSEISDLALEAEDLIEIYILKVSSKRQDGFMKDLKWLALCWMDARTLHKVGSKIDSLTAQVSKLSSRLHTYGVRSSYDFQISHMAITRKMLADQRRTYSHVEDKIIGLQFHVEDLTNRLQKGSQKIVIVHGMGGIGKTTLAREVFRFIASKGHFSGVAWAYVSQQLELGDVCKDILHQLIPEKDFEQRRIIRESQVSLLPGLLFEILKQRNYLVILDDLWTVRDWQCLQPAFPFHDSSCGSKLLITTRNPQIFLTLGDVVFPWEAKLLDADKSWELLEHKADFIKDDLDAKERSLCQKILNHCKGHPLAIVALGGVLATKRSLQEWESVSENLLTHLHGDESYSGVYEVLAMSYYDLPYYLKPCFLHMGHFPEDFQIGVERLYHLWIAEGVVSLTRDQVGRSKTSLEDDADNYLNLLVQKGMVQVADRGSDGRVTTCSLHDLMRDKCLEMTKEENFLQIVDLDQKLDSSDLRRLTMYVGHEAGQSVLKALLSGNAPSLRSLLFIATQPSEEESCGWVKSICKNFKLLRLLDFEGVLLKGTFPSEVGNLIYLRYLSLRGTHVTELPSSICYLRSLLILDLRVTGVVIKVPNILWKLTSLRHLYFPMREMSQEPHADSRRSGYEIEDSKNLILNKLSYLERLDDVDLDKVEVEGLVELKSMRKFSARYASNKESLVPFLQSTNIKDLKLNISARIVSDDPMILSACTSLHILHIDAPRNPSIVLPMNVGMYPYNLVELGFWYCQFPKDPMPILENLPKLRNLQLRICYNGSGLSCSRNAFPEVTHLALDGLFYVKKWRVQNGGFPKLQKLDLYNCPIDRIPDVLPPNIEVFCFPSDQWLVDQFRQSDLNVPISSA